MSESDIHRRRLRGHGSILDLAGSPPAKQASDSGKAGPTVGTKSLLSTEPGSPRLSTRRAAIHHGAGSSTGNHPDMLGQGQSPSAAGEPKRGLGARVSNLLGLDLVGSGTNFAGDAYHDVQQPNLPRVEPAGYPDHRFAHDGEKPLIDLSILIAAVWRYRGLIVGTTIIGAIAGVFIALSTPHKYYAEARLFIDPREIRLTEDELRSPLMSTEAMIAMIDSQAAILMSTNVLVNVVDDLGLARDAEFNGSLNSGGIAGGIALIKQLITGKDANSEAETEALTNLRDSMNVSRDPKTFVINIGVSSRDAEKSALISNAIVQTYLDAEGEAQSGLMERTSEAIDSRLETLRSDLNVAERAVENFKAENDLISVGKELIDDQQITAINQQLANARSTKVAVGVKADGLKKANIADVIDGAFPEEFLSANLVELRKQYSQSKSNADSLASRLGPRHPQFIAANSTLESVKSQIRSELRRIVASSQSELQRAIETEQELAAQLATAKTRSLENSEELVTLRELERKAAATRQIYESFLKRSRETSERGNFNTQNARIISPAEPPIHPDSTSRKVIAIGGMVIGGVVGLGIAIMLGMLESIRSFLPGPDGGRRRVPTGTPRHPGPGSGYRSVSQTDHPKMHRNPMASAADQPTGQSMKAEKSEKTEKTETAELAGTDNSIRDDDMNNYYDPAQYYATYGHAPIPPTHPAFQNQPYHPVAPTPYQGHAPYAGQGGYAPVHPQPVWQQAPTAWGYPQPQHQHFQPAPYIQAAWAQPQQQPIMQQPPQHSAPMFYPQPPLQQHHYQAQPAQAPGVQHGARTQQSGEVYADASSNNHRQQDDSDSEILEIRQKMNDLRQRIDQKNRRRVG